MGEGALYIINDGDFKRFGYSFQYSLRDYQPVYGWGSGRSYDINERYGYYIYRTFDVLHEFVASRLWANVLAMFFVILPMVQKNIGMAVPQLAYFSPVSWMRLSEFKIGGSGTSPSMSYCIAALGIMCILFSLVIIWKMRTVDFQMVKED